MLNLEGQVHSIETFGLVDGPGVRFIAFMQGCHMRCKYCHNPETWSMTGGTPYTPQALLDRAWRYRPYWKKNGGITVSGGEPLLQLDFVAEYFRLAKQKGVHTCLDTSGQPFKMTPEYLERFDKLMEVTDLFMLDFKEPVESKHRELTGHSNQQIFEMAHYLSDHGKAMWIRHVLVPGLTDDEEGLKALRAEIDSLKTVERVEILPYHTLGLFKWENLKVPYPLVGVRVPTPEEVKKAEDLLGIVK